MFAVQLSIVLLCCLQANQFDFVLVSVHLKATGFHNEDLDKLKVLFVLKSHPLYVIYCQ